MNEVPNHRSTRRLADEIADRSVRRLFERFVETYAGIHNGIRLEATSVEVRFFYEDEFLLRLSPYRELFHVQLGEGPAWETRIRSEANFCDGMDRALQRFLQVYAAAAGRRP